MASKGKPKRHEIVFESKRIDVRRLAYDVIKYSALKFGVPVSCIDIWKGSDNDYGCPDFCSALFRTFMNYQILLRCKFHAHFNQHYESNKLESYELIRRLFQDVINKYTKYPLYVIEDVELSLSIACELVLFLYSKKLNLHLRELALNWFDCYFHLVKKPFEKAGGLKEMYLRSSRPENYLENPFNDKFISVYCLPYDDSVKNRNLHKLLMTLSENYLEKFKEYFRQMQCKETDDIFVRESSRDGVVTEYEIVMLPVASERNEASGMDVHQNSNVGKTDFIEFLWSDSLTLTSFIDKVLSHVFPAANPRDEPQHSRVASAQKKIGKEVYIEARDKA